MSKISVDEITDADGTGPVDFVHGFKVGGQSFEVPQLTQTQAEDPTSTVFGTVSGQRLAQASSAGLTALATGASGSPRVRSEALTGIRQSRLQATSNSWVTITGLERYRSIDLLCAFKASVPNAVRDIQVQLSTDNGSSWTPARTVERFLQQEFVAYEGLLVNIGLQDGVIVANVRKTAVSEAYFNEGAASYNAVRIRQSNSSSSGNILQVVPYLWEDKT